MLSYLSFWNSRPRRVRRFLGVLLPTSVICAGIVIFLLLLQLMGPKWMSYFYSHVAVLVHTELCGLCPLEIRLFTLLSDLQKSGIAKGLGLILQLPFYEAGSNVLGCMVNNRGVWTVGREFSLGQSHIISDENCCGMEIVRAYAHG